MMFGYNRIISEFSKRMFNFPCTWIPYSNLLTFLLTETDPDFY